MKAMDINGADRLARFQDLNPMESMWDILATKFYTDRWKFQKLTSLKECVMGPRGEIPRDSILALAESMPRSCVEVIECKVLKTKH